MPGAPRSTWIKMAVAGVAMCVGGPALIYYVSPTEEELFLRYNPELQRRSLAARAERQEDFDAFVTRLKAYSKSDKPIWAEWEKDGLRKQEAGIAAQAAERRAAADKAEQLRAEVRAAAARDGR